MPGPLLSPTVLGEDSSSLSISLHPASVLQTSHDGRPRHFGLNYDLQMQQVRYYVVHWSAWIGVIL